MPRMLVDNNDNNVIASDTSVNLYVTERNGLSLSFSQVNYVKHKLITGDLSIFVHLCNAMQRYMFPDKIFRICMRDL